MGNTLFTVWPEREVKGWNGGEEELNQLDKYPVVPVLEGIHQVYDTDAHFWPGHLVDRESGEHDLFIPRINKKAVAKLEEWKIDVRFDILPIDIDDPITHKTGAPARPEWLEEVGCKIAETPWVHTAGLYYTRGGMRLIWQLPESLGIEDYLAYAKAFRAEMRCAGVDSDELVEFGRCFRLPNVNRLVGKVYQRQTLPVYFDHFGALNFTPRPGVLTGDKEKSKKGTRFEGIGAARITKPGYMAPEKITHHRNQELTRFAGKLRQLNMDPDGILAALTHMNETRCEPPLPDEEIEHIAESSATWTPGNNYNVVTAPPIIEPAPEDPASPPPAPDEDGPLSDLPFRRGPLGRMVARAKGPILATSAPRFTSDSPKHFVDHALSDIEVNGHPVVFTQGHLWRYDPKRGRWNHLPIQAVTMLLASYDGELILIETPKGATTRPFKVDTRIVNEVHTLLSHSRDDPDFFDHQEPGVTFRNGFATIENDQVVLKPFSPHQRAFTSIDMDCDPTLTPTMFVNFLQTCFRDDEDGEAKIAVLQEFVGACLLGRATEFQMGLIFIGGGANGKSTMQDVVLAMFDKSMITSIPPQDMDNEYRRAMLAKSRMNIVNELPEADILTSEGVKSLVTGDMITARHIREAPFQYRPRAGHIFSANNLPNVRDLTDGFFRRWTVISWNRKFEGPDRILKLDERIIAAELGAVAAWALAGAVRLQKQGCYTKVPSSTKALQEWREGSDQVAQWLSAYAYWPPLEGAQKKLIPSTDMYTNYSQWSAQNGHLKLGSHKFQKRLIALGVERTEVRAGYSFLLQRRTPLAVMKGGMHDEKESTKG